MHGLFIILLWTLSMIISIHWTHGWKHKFQVGMKSIGRFSKMRLSTTSKYIEDLPEGIKVPNVNPISWYPGHIAKAEKELSEYLYKVDVVVELRDARIPLTTAHPRVPEWVGSKPILVGVGRIDQISSKALADWREYFTMNPVYPNVHSKVIFLNGKSGIGTGLLKKEILKIGMAINARRERRGIQPRAVRAAIIGYPNVGKSALINRLLNRKLAKSMNLPGVTKSLQWIRLGGIQNDLASTIELLDSPGIIPARQCDQEAALKLAMCNDIGEASYDRVYVASHLCDYLNALHRDIKGYVDMKTICQRYGLPFHEMSGDEFIYAYAKKQYHGNDISCADRLLGDFRRGFLTYGSLECPPLEFRTMLETRQKSKASKQDLPSDLSMEKGNSISKSSKIDVHSNSNSNNSNISSNNGSGSSGPARNNTVPTTMGHHEPRSPKSPLLSDESIDFFEIGKGKYDGW